jgi:hypothetical protein
MCADLKGYGKRMGANECAADAKKNIFLATGFVAVATGFVTPYGV